uniref:peroxidase n=1 Tax=Chenopodium quinoa TaxID=63459 RepID=A0A803L7H2_CHEQI
MQFHDCFVHGCDASILIMGLSSEKTAGPNLSVRGYELIDALKDIAETQCPGVVSCADIIAIATKEVLRMALDVLIGSQGEIRKTLASVISPAMEHA